MRQKFCVTLLAMTLTLAGAREASRQFQQLRENVTDWTRTSVWGGLLVFAGSGAAGASARPTYLVANASAPACPTAKPRAASNAAARQSRQKGATPARAGATEVASHGRAAAAEELAVRVVAPLLAEPAVEIALAGRGKGKSLAGLGAELEALARYAGARYEADAARAGEWRADARAVTELVRLARKKAFVRVDQSEGPSKRGPVSAARWSELIPPAHAAPRAAGAVPKPPARPKAEPRAATVDSDEDESFNFTQATSGVTLDCDGRTSR